MDTSPANPAVHNFEAAEILDHLTDRLVDELEQVVQAHTIEGLLKPDY
jgi:hypothetical protein